MKKLPALLSLSLISFLVISCSKKDSTEEVAQTQNEIRDTVVSVDTVSGGVTSQDEMNLQNDTYTYKAEDGTLATLTFLNTDFVHTLTVKMNDKEYVLDQTEAWAKGAAYEKDGVKAHSQRDDLDLTMDGKTLKLKRQYEK
ncbi:hypothetical protein [Kaistella sp.]|uniref:hypothetical protein n=3 Tax=Kaistella sp. TaxID=2782235 RepID=UPI00359FC3FC